MSPTKSFPGAEVIIHNPEDYPDVLQSSEIVAPGEDVRIAVSPEVIKSDSTIRPMDAIQRDCWFKDEVNLVFSKKYSFESCTAECRASYTVRLCGCLPFFYPFHGKQY